MSSGATSSRATSRSISAATACACARSLSQRQNATSPPFAAAQLLLDPVRRRLGDRPRGGQDALRAAVRLLQPHDRRRRPLGLEVAQVLGRRAAQAVDRLVVVARSADLAVLARQQPHQQALGEVRVLQLVDEQVAVALGHPRPHARLRAQEPEGVEQQVAEVERPALLEHAVVGRRRGRRTRARGRPRARASPPRPRSRRAETSSSFRRSMRPTIEPSSALGLPRRSCEASGSSSMRSSSIAMRSAGVTGAANGSSPASSASSCSSAGAEVVHGGDGQLVEAAVEAGLEPLAQPRRAGLGDREDEDRLRRQPAFAHQPGEALAQHGGLAGARAAEHEQGAAGVGDGLELAGGRRHHRRIGPVAAPDPARDTDWLRICRRATSELRGILRDRPTTAERVREVGTLGEGGDRTLLIDAAAEDAVFNQLAGLHDQGLRFTAVSEERGHGRLRRDRHARRDRPDRRLGQRQARPPAPLDLDRGRRRGHDGGRLLRLRPRLRAGRGVGRAARPGRLARRPPAVDRAGRAPRPRRQARAARDRIRRPALGPRRSATRWPSAPTACARSGRSPPRSARSPPRGSTAWSRSAAAARSTPPRAS